jgi:hypothetical protein
MQNLCTITKIPIMGVNLFYYTVQPLSENLAVSNSRIVCQKIKILPWQNQLYLCQATIFVLLYSRMEYFLFLGVDGLRTKGKIEIVDFKNVMLDWPLIGRRYFDNKACSCHAQRMITQVTTRWLGKYLKMTSPLQTCRAIAYRTQNR